MFLFEKDKQVLNRSLVASMDYIYKGSDDDLESWWDLIPGYSSKKPVPPRPEVRRKKN